MLSEFPIFKKLEFSDKEDIEKITSKFLPYSDFNFTSMWVWDIHHHVMISRLNKNLVVIFNDYMSDDLFLSFLGKEKILDTISKLIRYSKENYKNNKLKLISEESSNLLSKNDFNIISDRDSFDYIYSVSELSNMNNWNDKSIGKTIKKFIKLFPNYVVTESSILEISRIEYLKFFTMWADNKNIDDIFELNEYKAFERLLQLKDKNIKFISLYLDGILIGFNVYEILSKDHAISHFSKINTKNHQYATPVLNWEEAKILNKHGVKYFNWEQDLGIAGLRYSKEKYKPSSFLKKYIVYYKSEQHR